MTTQPETKQTTVQAHTDIFRWQVKNFSQLDPRTGQSIVSPVFVGTKGIKWQMQLYAGGNTEVESKGLVSLFVQPVDLPAPVNGRLQLSIVRPGSGELYQLITDTTITWRKGHGFGKAQVSSRSNLLDETKGLMLNDLITFQAQATVIDPISDAQPTAEAKVDEYYPTTTFTWAVINFSKLNGTTKSDPFDAGGGTRWQLKLGAFQEEKKDSVSIYVLSLNTKEQQMRDKIDIISRVDGKSFQSLSGENMYRPPSDSWGWKTYMTKTQLLSDAYKGALIDDTLTIEVQVTPKKMFSDQVVAQAKNASIDLSDLLKKKVYCDTTIFMGGQETPAHRCILAAHSPVFRAMFEAKMLENQDHEVHLDDVDRATADALITFMYSGKHAEDTPTAELLSTFAVAHRYQITALQGICSAKLIQRLDPDNFVDLYICAERYEDALLKSECARFLSTSDKREKLLADILASRSFAPPPPPLSSKGERVVAQVQSSRCCGIM